MLKNDMVQKLIVKNLLRQCYFIQPHLQNTTKGSKKNCCKSQKYHNL